ncbi:hypothetical protein SAMN05216275_15910 [Streptosporangium canum]|uniref:Uncharacterized protein n=1 Tax=Streptosporangium canum TaxID=324952 RepID=A0A1I4F8C6_9ACTN|nr:hypothetical protein [Streptosporangium canum]SFL14232.1 hypothetical protein SAMN05216275_15910 [Streptosporangium canum]
MVRSSSSDDELRAAVAARRELGPEYEDSLVEGFLEKMDQEIDRRVDDRIAARSRKDAPAVRPSVDAGQRLALSIASIFFGVGATAGIAASTDNGILVILILWLGIVGVNVSFALGRRR